jgi:hypothetical protein
MLANSWKRVKAKLVSMPPPIVLPEIVLFGDSLTEWSFSEDTQGFGLHFRQQYAGKATIINEGKRT